MLEIANVIDIQVSQAPVGLGEYNVNNVALFTSETPITNSLGSWAAYVSPSAVAADWGTESETYLQARAMFSQSPNLLSGGGNLIVIPLENGESLEDALIRTKDMVYYCGIITTDVPTNSVISESFADAVQSEGDKMWIFPQSSTGAIAGVFSEILNATCFATRCILYTKSARDSRLMAAAYAGKGFSTNFNASNGTKTMNLKQLSTIVPDDAITQTLWQQAKTKGVDLYVSYGGVPSVVSNGANKFFDEIYNLIWFVNALKVAGFNLLAQVGSKVPQTEPGVSLLKSAYAKICEQALSNAYIAPGSWTSAERFGNPEDMLANIEQRGYYIYSQPVNQQNVADRQARKAPLIQIAVKEAGAIHSSELIINVNP